MLTSSPALTLLVKSLVTPAIRPTLPSATLPSMMMPLLNWFLRSSTMPRSALLSAPLSCATSTLTPAICLTWLIRPALSFAASLSFNCWISFSSSLAFAAISDTLASCCACCASR
ncbi:Uncharacterised protein [Vibrio cholerae]|nr:Uncharacterised protein [Vibrio cholerae]CSC27629.1 Uncharacterised protein [Vibrio cholerae]